MCQEPNAQAEPDVTGALAMLDRALTVLASAEVASLPGPLQAEALRALERAEARHTVARARMLAAFAAQRGQEEDGHGSVRTWLRWQTRITRAAAAGAVGWARRMAAHPVIAEALADGGLSSSWARQICAWTDRLPEGKRDDADQILTGAAAGGAELTDLAGLAEEMYQRCGGSDDDDGFEDRYFRLGLTLRGAGRAEGDLTPGCATALNAVLEALSKKAGPEDARTVGQRRHDALEEACRRLITAGMVPGRAGQPTHIQLHMTLSQLRDLPGAATAEQQWATAHAGREAAAHRDLEAAPAGEPARGTGREPGPGAGREPGIGAGREPGIGAGREPGIGAGREPGPGAGPEAGPGTEREPRAGAGSEAGPETGWKPGPGAGPEAGPGTEREPRAGAGREPGPEAGPEAGPGTEREPRAGTGREPGPGTGREPGPAAGHGTAAAAWPGPEPVGTGWAPARAREPGWLTGPEAEAAACDATIVPLVTGRPDPAALDRFAAALLTAYGTGNSHARDGGAGSGPGPGSLPGVSRRRLRRALLALATEVLSGTDGLAGWLRGGLLRAPELTSPSLPLDIGAATETIPAHLRRAAVARHPNCAFPGCRQPASVCQIHHLVPRAAGGPTALHNLVTLCSFHHLIAIHRWGWTLTLHPDGTTTATSPDRSRSFHSHSPPAHAA